MDDHDAVLADINVAQIEDKRVELVIDAGTILEATLVVLRNHGGLWFQEESFVVPRRRE